MEIEYKQPKLKDSLYGEMLWEDYDDGSEYFWFSNIADVSGEKFQIYIVAVSPLDFLAVRSTHSTYKKLIADLPEIRRKTISDLLKNEELNFVKKRQKNSAVEKIEKTLKLQSIKIYSDLSSVICFDSEMFEGETDEFIFTLIGSDGAFLEAEIDTY